MSLYLYKYFGIYTRLYIGYFEFFYKVRRKTEVRVVGIDQRDRKTLIIVIIVTCIDYTEYILFFDILLCKQTTNIKPNIGNNKPKERTCAKAKEL